MNSGNQKKDSDHDKEGKKRIRIVVDSDGCPVKDEVARVAKRLQLPVVFVANRFMKIPSGSDVRLEGGSELFDAAAA